MTVPMKADTPIAQLCARLERYPKRREAVQRVDLLKQVHLLVTQLRDEAVLLRRQRAHVQAVFPEADMSGSGRQIQSVQARAVALSRLLGPAVTASENDVQRAAADLRRSVEGARAAVEREWSVPINDVVAKYDRLSAALQKSGVRGGTDLKTVVGRVRSLSHPPATQDAVRRAADDLASLGPTLARLGLVGGLGGAVGGFLVAVAEGRGSVKSVLDSEVRGFLDQHDLWDVLTVSFR